MTPERARELLGGLSTGILTPEERQLLFEAALHDQMLFNEVADELEFAAFLQSPETRAQLANRIETGPERRQWWPLSPAWFGLSAALAASAVVFVAVWHHERNEVFQDAAAIAPPTAQAPPARSISAPAPPPPGSQTVDGKRTALRPKTAARRLEPAKEPPVSESRSMSMRGPTMRPTPMAPVPPPVTATIEGTVHDPSGAPLPRAVVRIVNQTTNVTTDAVSDDEGRFAAHTLAPGGPYTVVAQAQGFRKKEQSGITVEANQPAQVDLPLQPAPVSDVVEVTAAAPAVSGFRAMGGLAAAKAGIGGEAPRQVAVLDFISDMPQNQSGQQAADLLTERLVGSGQVRVIDRQRVQQAETRAQLQPKPSRLSKFASHAAPAQAPSANDAAALGRALGADKVIVGRVASAPNVEVSAQVIDTRNAQPMPTVRATAPTIQAATNLVGLQVESQLTTPLEGKVTSVNGESVGVSFPAPAEPRIGARFDVLRDNRKIGELTITSTHDQAAGGNFSGTEPPLPGDRVASTR